MSLQGPGGLECNTGRECKKLAAKQRALALKKKQEEEEKEQSIVAEQVYLTGGSDSNPQTPEFEAPESGQEKIRNIRGHKSDRGKVSVFRTDEV